MGKNFRGDNRSASVRNSGPNLTGATSRASATVGWYSADQRSKLLSTDSDMTVRYKYGILKGTQKKPTVNASNIHTINNQYPQHVPGTYGVKYDAKDPLTPKNLTPSLDVMVTGKITQGNGYIDISGNAMGDGFPSTEAFIEDSIGTRILLGAHREQGDVSTLYGGADENIFNFNMRISTDSAGNFNGVYNKDKTEVISPQKWNQGIIEDF